jgi:ATP-binding cassette, subfamily B, bacterial
MSGLDLRSRSSATTRAFVLRYVRSWRWHVTALLSVVVLAACCAIGVQYQMKLLVDAMTRTGHAEAAWIALAGFIGLVALESLFWRICGWLACRTTIGVGVDIRFDLFDALSHQSMRYFAENLAGSLGHRVTGAAGNFGALINTLVWRITPPLVDFLGALIIFTLVDARMAVALFLYVAAVTAGLIVLGERGRSRHETYAAKAGCVGGELIDVISNMWAVKAFAARERERARLREKFEDEAAAQRGSWMYTEAVRVVYDFVLWTMAAGMLFWAMNEWRLQNITAGDVVVVSTLTFRILHGSRDVSLALVDLMQHLGYIGETLRVIRQAPTLNDSPSATALAKRGGCIEFKDVQFGYGATPDALRDFSLKIASGEKLGIVGPSGAGKSTLLQLIQRLYDVQSGEISIDGRPLRDLTQDSLRAALAVVPQEVTLFHRTVAENIRFGRPDATDAEVYAAARAAHCDDFVRRLPYGYETLVGERGVKLSGGQRQRIGIARAFLKDAPTLLFDEATSALDTQSELEVQRTILERLNTRTVIAIAHRLSTLIGFDRIVVISGGRIVEAGTIAELRSMDGVFERLWRLQAGESLQEACAVHAGGVPEPRRQSTARAQRAIPIAD